MKYTRKTEAMVLLTAVLMVLVFLPQSSLGQRVEPQPVVIENSLDNAVPVFIRPDVRVCADPNCPVVMRRESDKYPFQWTGHLQHLDASAGTTPHDGAYATSKIFNVAARSLLVIEYVSAEARFAPNNGKNVIFTGKNAGQIDSRMFQNEPVGGLRVTTTVSGITARHFVNFQPQSVQLAGNFPVHSSILNPFRFVASEQVRLYAEAGSEVVVSFMTNRMSGKGADGEVEVSISGYLVPFNP